MGNSQPGATPNLSRANSLHQKHGLSKRPILAAPIRVHSRGRSLGRKDLKNHNETTESDESTEYRTMFGDDILAAREHSRRMAEYRMQFERNSRGSHSPSRSVVSTNSAPPEIFSLPKKPKNISGLPRAHRPPSRLARKGKVNPLRGTRLKSKYSHKRSSSSLHPGGARSTANSRATSPFGKISERSLKRKPRLPRRSESRPSSASSKKHAPLAKLWENIGRALSPTTARRNRLRLVSINKARARVAKISREQVKKDSKMRDNIVRELVDTEQTYVKLLSEICEALATVNNDRGILTESRNGTKGVQALMKIIQNIKSIFELQKRFLADLNYYIYGIGEPRSKSGRTPEKERSRSETSRSKSRSRVSRILNSSFSALSKIMRSLQHDGMSGEGGIDADQNGDGTVMNVAKLFNHYGKFFQIYTSYINYFHDASKFLSEYYKKGGRINGIRDANALITLNAKLILPIQRVPRYVLMLKELTKYSRSFREGSKNRESLRALSKAREIVEVTAEGINESMANRSNQEKMWELQKDLICESNILAPQRKLRKEGTVKLQMANSNNQVVSRSAKVALFNDLIIFACLCPKITVYMSITVVKAVIPGTKKSGGSAFAKLAISTSETEKIPIGTTPSIKLKKEQRASNVSYTEWHHESKSKIPGDVSQEILRMGESSFEVLLTGIKEDLPSVNVEVWEGKEGFGRSTEYVGQARIDPKAMFREIPAEMDRKQLFHKRATAWYRLAADRSRSSLRAMTFRKLRLSTDSKSNRLSNSMYDVTSSRSRNRSSVTARSSPRALDSSAEVKVRVDLIYSLAFGLRRTDKEITRECRSKLKYTLAKAYKRPPKSASPRASDTRPTAILTKHKDTSLPLHILTNVTNHNSKKYYQYLNLAIDENLSINTDLDLRKYQKKEKKEGKVIRRMVKEGKDQKRYFVSLEGSRKELREKQSSMTTPSITRKSSSIRREHSPRSRNFESQRFLLSASSQWKESRRNVHPTSRIRSSSTDSRNEGEDSDYNDSHITDANDVRTITIRNLSAYEAAEWIKNLRSSIVERIKSDVRAELSRVMYYASEYTATSEESSDTRRIRVVRMSNSKKTTVPALYVNKTSSQESRPPALLRLEDFVLRNKLFIDMPLGTSLSHKGGQTALMCFAEKGYIELCRILCKAGANVEHADSQGQTPLIKATKNKHPEVVRILLKYRANPYHLDVEGLMALEHIDDTDAKMLEVYSHVLAFDRHYGRNVSPVRESSRRPKSSSGAAFRRRVVKRPASAGLG